MASRGQAALGVMVLLVGVLLGLALPGLVAGITAGAPEAFLAPHSDTPVDPALDGPRQPAGPDGQSGPGSPAGPNLAQDGSPLSGAEATKRPDPSATVQPPPVAPTPSAATPQPSPVVPGATPTKPSVAAAPPAPQPAPAQPGQAPGALGRVPGQPGLAPVPPGQAPVFPDGRAPQAPPPSGKPWPDGGQAPPLPPGLPPMMQAPPGSYGLPPGMPGGPMLPLTPPGTGPGFVPLPGMPSAEWGSALPADVAYGSDPLQHLDVYPARGSGPAPMLLFVHGGGWSMGDKSELNWLGAKLSEQGVLVAVANYRLSPAVQHPTHAQDVARAVAWLYHNGANYGGDPQRLYLGGHSAGAHLASLVALDGTYLAAEGLSPSIVRSVVGISGAGYDLDARYTASPLAQLFYAAFGKDPTRWAAAAPMTYVDHAAPPFLLIHGLEDTQAPAAGAQSFAQALKREGSPIRLELLPGMEHGTALLAALPALRALVQ
jgi:acetyl esterase/lipase